MRRVLLIVLAALGGTLPAGAQDPRLDRVDPATRSAVDAIIDSARAAGLPAEPLVDRALEGAIKHATGELIVAAVRRLATLLGRAREILGSRATPAELESGAAALRAGADAATLAQLRKSRPRQSLTLSLAVLADLVASGVPPDTAASAVLALADLEDEGLIEFRRSVEHDIALGVLPATAASVRVLATARRAPAADGPVFRRP